MSGRWAGVAGAVLLACAACSSSGSVHGGAGTSGGGTSGSGTSGARTSGSGAPTSGTVPTPAAGSASQGAAGASPGGLTPPGTHLRAGQTAMVGWVPPSMFSVTEAQQGYKLQVDVESIEKGTADDLKNVQLDAGQQGSTPYFVKVRIKALDAVPASVTDSPAASLDAIDDRGQQQGSVIFLGTFDRCPDTDPPKPFGAGKSFESCLTYLMPGGGAITRMQWADGPSGAGGDVTLYFDDPISWE